MKSKSNTIISIILIMLLTCLVAFLYFQNNAKTNIFIPADSYIFLASKNSKLEKFFTLDQDFKNISWEKIFYVWSWRKNYIFQNKILWTSWFYENPKLDNYNISQAFENYKNKNFDWFFVKDIFWEKIFWTSSWDHINIFLVWISSKKASFWKPTESDFFFSWWALDSKKFEVFLESEYFSGLKTSEKSNLKKFFSTPWAINIYNWWQIISTFTWDARFLEKLDNIWLSWNFFSWKYLRYWTKDFSFSTWSENEFLIFWSKKFFPYSFSWKADFKYWYQKFDIILQ